MRYSFLLIISFLTVFHVHAQRNSLCVSMERDSVRRANNPSLGTLDDFERAMQRAISIRNSQLQSRSVLTLPVIVHVIHNGEDVGVGSNISFEQIMSQIEVLNEDYRKKAGTPGDNNDPVGADVELEFCPATLDPNDDPLFERGVNRINRNDFSWTAPPWSDIYIDNNIKPLTFWDPDRYLNIWVAEISGNVLGFAQFPNMAGLNGLPNNNGDANTDGIVVSTPFFGRVGNVTAPYDKGRTATHEIGHWLGVFHLEGRDRGGCSQDDFCADTPESDAKNFGCATGHVSCGSADMVRNYMDASDDVCMNIFTQDQKTRMRTVISNSPRRGILANSNSCTENLPPAIAIESSGTIVCEGQSVRFSDASINAPDEWNWSFPGGVPATSTDRNPTVVYPNAGVYSVTLEAGNSFGSRSQTFTDVITVNTSDPSIVFEERFENGIPNTWTIDNPDNGPTWETQATGGSRSGNNTAYVQLYFYAAVGARDGLISPPIDLSGVSNLSLKFDHSYVQGFASERDSLIVYASTNGGNTFPHVLARLGDDGMQSFATQPPVGTGPFVPAVDDDWCYSGDGAQCLELDLEAFEGESQFALRFETVSDFGNNIYLDNVEIEGTCNIVGINPQLVDQYNLNIYPNPNEGRFKVQLEELRGDNLGFSLFNLNGQLIKNWNYGKQGGFFEERFEIGDLPPGTYILKTRIGTEEVYRKILLVGA